VQIPYGCKQGICQSCLVRSLDTAPPVTSQTGLKDTLQHQNYFLACRCYPERDMTITLSNDTAYEMIAWVSEKENLSAEIVRLVLVFETNFSFLAGQFVNLQRSDGLTRSYSIANVPERGNFLEFHIQRLPNGRFSNWVHDELEVGTDLTVSEAKGTCHYLPGRAEQPLLLVGTGSGLAPLLGIVNDALGKGHSGPIRLFHGSRKRTGLYLINEMKTLSKRFGNFNYTPCISGDHNTDEFTKGRAHDVALSSIDTLKGWRVYLCGHPEMVVHTKKMAYLKGASLSDIYADAFHIAQHTN
jgi:NAD(P)H-flavin reductase